MSSCERFPRAPHRSGRVGFPPWSLQDDRLCTPVVHVNTRASPHTCSQASGTADGSPPLLSWSDAGPHCRVSRWPDRVTTPQKSPAPHSQCE